MLHPSAKIQLREMSATRVNKGKVKTNQIRSKYHAHSQLRKVPTMSAMPRQRRECQPECQERVEAKSKQTWSKYNTAYRLREMSATGPNF